MGTDFLGTGWSFPVRIDGRGGIARSRGERDIEESIWTILRTVRGERVMRPNFGSDLGELLFAPNSAATAGLVDHHVREALAFWEPRIDIEDVEVRSDPADSARLSIHLTYLIKATSDRRNLVYPFYTIPHEA
jgi:phage baseplate assembly protein W